MSTCVFFFGGYLATPDDMKAWKASAQAQESDVAFTAYPWPRGTHWSRDSAVATARSSGLHDEALAAIKASRAGKTYVVGHSSGCAIANAVDKALEDTGKVVLVALNGFSPDPRQLERLSTQVGGLSAAT